MLSLISSQILAYLLLTSLTPDVLRIHVKLAHWVGVQMIFMCVFAHAYYFSIFPQGDRVYSPCAKLAVLAWRYLNLGICKICNLQLLCLVQRLRYVQHSQGISISYIHIYGSRLSIQHSYTELQVTLTVRWSVHLVTGLKHIPLMAIALPQLCVVFLAPTQLRWRQVKSIHRSWLALIIISPLRGHTIITN